MNLYCSSTKVFIWSGNHGGSRGLNMFMQHVTPPSPPPISHVVNGWASASVMKDRHSGEFTGPPLSSKLQHCSDVFVPAFCLTAGTSSRSVSSSSPVF